MGIPKDKEIIHCNECCRCFRTKGSKTGYACEAWGHGDFADDTVLTGYCHKAKPLYDYQIRYETWRNLEEKEN